MDYRCSQNTALIDVLPSKKVSFSTTSVELQELLVPLREQLRQEILAEVQGYITNKFVALQKHYDKTLAKKQVQLEKLSCLEESVEIGLANIHATQRSLSEFADNLESTLTDTMYQKIFDMAAVKDQVRSIHAAVQKWSEYQQHAARQSEDDKLLLEENSDIRSTRSPSRSPSDGSDETISSGEERQEANRGTYKTTPEHLKGNLPPTFQLKNNKRVRIVEHSNLCHSAKMLAPDERSSFDSPFEMRLNSAPSELADASASPETCTKDLRKTIAHLMPKLRECLKKPISVDSSSISGEYIS